MIFEGELDLIFEGELDLIFEGELDLVFMGEFDLVFRGELGGWFNSDILGLPGSTDTFSSLLGFRKRRSSRLFAIFSCMDSACIGFFCIENTPSFARYLPSLRASNNFLPPY